MDSQLKRGMLDACILKVLSNGKSYGYQIIKDVSCCISISESTLYPILRRLEANKLVTVTSVEYNGRLRKYYEITKLGEKELNEFIKSWEEVIVIYDFLIGKEEGKHE